MELADQGTSLMHNSRGALFANSQCAIPDTILDTTKAEAMPFNLSLPPASMQSTHALNFEATQDKHATYDSISTSETSSDTQRSGECDDINGRADFSNYLTEEADLCWDDFQGCDNDCHIIDCNLSWPGTTAPRNGATKSAKMELHSEVSTGNGATCIQWSDNDPVPESFNWFINEDSTEEQLVDKSAKECIRNNDDISGGRLSAFDSVGRNLQTSGEEAPASFYRQESDLDSRTDSRTTGDLYSDFLKFELPDTLADLEMKHDSSDCESVINYTVEPAKHNDLAPPLDSEKNNAGLGIFLKNSNSSIADPGAGIKYDRKLSAKMARPLVPVDQPLHLSLLRQNDALNGLVHDATDYDLEDSPEFSGRAYCGPLSASSMGHNAAYPASVSPNNDAAMALRGHTGYRCDDARMVYLTPRLENDIYISPRFHHHMLHSRNRSISKMPLSRMYELMGLGNDHNKAKWREERIMDIVKAEGFDVGNQTWIRDTEESTRKRIIDSIYEQTKEFGYTPEILEVIVRRGTYARMQSKLRQRRRHNKRTSLYRQIAC